MFTYCCLQSINIAKENNIIIATIIPTTTTTRVTIASSSSDVNGVIVVDELNASATKLFNIIIIFIIVNYIFLCRKNAN